MRNRLVLSAFVLVALLACRSAPTAPETDATSEAAPEPPRGLTVLPYDGAWADYPPVRVAQEELGVASAKAADRVVRRLGLAIDPDRPRQIAIVDDALLPGTDTRVVAGRVTQVLEVPAGPLARGAVPLAETLAYVFTLAALSDLAGEEVPAFYVNGAPLWVSGGWERALYDRILGGPLVPDRVNGVVPPSDLPNGGSDPLAAALFFRFLSEEFGADRIPSLSRALLSTDTPEEAFRAALGTAPESLPVAFDGYRSRVVSEILADDFVRLLTASRRRAPADRIPALSGLAVRAPNRFVAGAVLSDLALAQFEAGQFRESALTYARIERDFAGFSLNADRDLLFFGLTFARTDDPDSARLRLESFLTEYPGSTFASLALLELAAIHTEGGEMDLAVARYAEIVARFPQSQHATPARLVLAASARSAHRHAVARRHLESALPDPGAKRALADLDALESAGLPEAAEPGVRSAVRDLVGDEPEAAEAAVAFLVDVGPLARPLITAPFIGREQLRNRAARLRALTVIATWTREESWPNPLASFLHGDDAEVAARVFDVLAAFDVSEAEIAVALDLAPYSVAAAAAEYDRRYRASSETNAMISAESFRDRLIGAQRLATEDRDDALVLLGRLLADKSPQVRRAAAAALGEREERDAGRVLGPALTDESRLVRMEALFAYARLGDVVPARTRGLADAEGSVRVAAAQILFETKETEDIALAVALLADTDGLVRVAVEKILRADAPDELGPVLASSLRVAELPGQGVRIVRVMSHHTGVDFGYDPYGGIEERRRVANAFLIVWPRRKNR